MTTQFTLRTKHFQPHEAQYWEARRQAYSEILWFKAAVAEADDTYAEVAYSDVSADEFETLHCAAETAEWLMENPTAVSILRAQGWLNMAEDWADMRPKIEKIAIEIHRSRGA